MAKESRLTKEEAEEEDKYYQQRKFHRGRPLHEVLQHIEEIKQQDKEKFDRANRRWELMKKKYGEER